MTIRENYFEKLQYIFDNSNDNIYLLEVTSDGRFKYLETNQAYIEFIGIPKEAIVGCFVDEIEDKAIRNTLLKKFNACLEAGEKIEHISEFNLANGYKIFQSTLSPMCDEDGRITKIVGIARDITAQTQAQEELQKREREYHDLIENIPDPVIRYDKECRRTYINEAWERVNGINRENALGKSPIEYSVVISPFAKKYQDKLMGVMTSGKPDEWEISWVDADKKRITFALRGVPEYDGNGEICGVLTTARDITQRKLDEEKKLDEQMRFFFEKQLVGMAIISPQKGWLKVNEKLCEMLGYSLEEFKSLTWVEMTHAEDLAAEVEQFERMLNGEIESYTLEKRFIHKNGTTVFTNLAVSCVRHSDGTIDYVLALIEDITNRVCSQEALHEINNTLEKRVEFRTLELKNTVKKLNDEIVRRKKQEEKLRQNEDKFRSLAENAHDPIYRYDRECHRIYVNPAVTKLSGKPAEELLGKKSTEARVVSMEDSIKVVNSIKRVIETGENHEIELLFTSPDGTQRYYLHNHVPEFGEDGKVESVLAIGRDITAQKELASREQMFRTLAENSPNIIMRYDTNCRRIYVNPAYSRHTGIPLELAVHSSPEYDWSRYLSMITMSALEYEKRILNVIKTGYSDNFLVEWHRISDGGYIAYDLNIVPERNTDGKITGALAIGHNVTERKSIEKRVEYMAHHDALTGLPNRILAKDRAQHAIVQSKQLGKQSAILFIDIDEFKTVNDSLGHSVGDAILKLVAARLKQSIRAGDTISRQGGDEFLLISPFVNNVDEIKIIADNLLKEFNNTFNINNHNISISASIGVALYPEHGENFEQLLQSADAAMYRAKEMGKNNYCFFTQQMKHNFIGLFQMQNDLKDAIKQQEFELHYQPQIELAQNKIVAAEALIRWNHPQQGMIAPMSFIPIAESTGLIVEIGEWVIMEACRQAALWNKEGKEIVVAVNISAVQFQRGNLEEVVKNALKVTGLNPKYLELELTESILISDTENVLQTVQVIKELGIQLSIDDFGTGYSSLAYLKRFAVDKLKIDQSFVRDILNDKENASIVKTIIQMAKSFNLRSIAEGVEDKEVLALVKEFGCDEVQGYHFAKPMRVDEFEDYYINKFQ